MNNNYDSFLEIAVALMKKKKKPQSLEAVTKEVFSRKGIEGNELEVAQFQVDFMLSGYFVCCGEDKNGNQLWDLKVRQTSSFLDKDSGYMKDMSEEDEEASNNELKDEYHSHDNIDQYIEEDDEETNEKDDIEEDLGLVSLDEADDEEEIINIEIEDDEEDEDDF